MRRWRLAAGAAAVALLAAACGSSGGTGTGTASGPVTLTIWHNYGTEQNATALQNLAKAFHKLHWIKICTKLRATGMPIKMIRRYAELVRAGRGNEEERLALLEAHRAEVTARLAELRENLRLIDHKIDVYRGRLDAGDADRLWAPAPEGAGHADAVPADPEPAGAGPASARS